MADDWLQAVREASGVERRDSETATEYLRRVGEDVGAQDRAATAVQAYNAARFGPTADLAADQEAALDAFLAAVREREGGPSAGESDPAEEGESAGQAAAGSPPTEGTSQDADGAGPGTDADTAPPPSGAGDEAASGSEPPEDRQPGRGLEPAVTVPDVSPLEAGPGALGGEGSALPALRRGEVAALVAVVLFVASAGVAAATAGPAPVTGGSLAVSAQGGFGGTNGYVTATGSDWESDRMAGAFEADWVAEDRLLATVLERGRRDCGPRSAPCARAGFRVYDVGDDAVVREWTRPLANDTAPTVLTATMLPNGTVVVADPHRGGLVAVRPDGRVAWRWNATAYYGTGADAPSPSRLSVTDVDHLGGQRYLLTVALTDQVLVLERGVGVVEVVNADRNESVLDGPHDAEVLGPGRLVVADSRNGRVVGFERTATGWDRAWTLSSAGGRPLSLPRDVDALADGTLLVTDSLNDRVVQVTRDGAVHRSASAAVPFAADAPGERDPDAEWAATRGPAAPRVAVLSGLYLAADGALGLPFWADQWLLAVGLLAAVVALAGGGHAAMARRQS